jgi:outer membrane protein assembly factor BamB
MPRPRWRRWLRLVSVLVALVVMTLVLLVYAFDMRVELDGSARRPLVTFGSREAHFTALERQRAAQRAQSPPPAPSLATATTPTAAAATDAPSPGTIAARSTTSPSASTATTAPVIPAPIEAAKTAPASLATAWTDFRGAGRDGSYAGAVALPWPAGGPTPLWKQPIGEGYASFVAVNGRAFTIEQRRGQEVVTAYDVDSGRELWAHGWDARFSERMGGDGPRATPAWHGGRVYALGATGELRCLRDSDGALLWRRDILSENEAPNLQWGMAASPLVVDDKVIVLPGGPGGRSVVAYHKDTGERLWSVLDDAQAYTAPMAATLLGTRQLLVVSAQRLMGLAIGSGALLWEYPWVTDYGMNVAQPIAVADNRVFISAGSGHGAAVVELTRDGERWNTRTLWHNQRMKNQFGSSVLHDGHVYGLDQAILACIDVATGELKWKGGRYGFGQLLLASGHLVVLTERGELALVRATPASHQELGVVPAIEGKTWNPPAIADGRLLVRNAREMAAFDLRLPR